MVAAGFICFVQELNLDLSVKYAVIKVSAFESGKVFIGPDRVLTEEQKAFDYAQFCNEAYKDEHVVLELRPIEPPSPRSAVVPKRKHMTVTTPTTIPRTSDE